MREKTFGLVFEERLPETVQLPTLPIRRGATVCQLKDKQQRLYPVTEADKHWVTVKNGDKFETIPASSVVVTKRFGEPIFPALRIAEKAQRGGDKPFHLLIEAENFHSLHLLLYTHKSKLDVVYINPPYHPYARH